MTVRELEEILKTVEDKDMEVLDTYSDKINGYYFDSKFETLFLSRNNVQPRVYPKS